MTSPAGRRRPSAGWLPAAAVVITVMLASPAFGAPDPAGDVGSCPRLGAAGDAAGAAPDLVSATGEVVELGTSVRFTLRFAEPLAVPDRRGHPFRVEIVLHDPDVPGVDAGLYRDVNRVLRYDAVPDPVTTTLLLPEAGQSRFIAPAIDDDTLVFQVPGRTLVADEDETGTSPGVGRLRWGVIVRDEGVCDLLGAGRADRRLVVLEGPTEGSAPEPSATAPARADGGVPGWSLAVGIVVLLVAGVALLRRHAPPRGG